jgi:hypothetical protein
LAFAFPVLGLALDVGLFGREVLYGPLAGPLVAVGGALGVAGFALFAFGLGVSLRRLPGLRA